MKLIHFLMVLCIFPSSFGLGSGTETSSYGSESDKTFRSHADPDPQHWFRETLRLYSVKMSPLIVSHLRKQKMTSAVRRLILGTAIT
jgi:hypothetical protein